MIKNYKNKAIMILSVIAILAFGAYAFADWGQIDHMIAVKKITPNADRGFMERGPRGYGSSYRGSCWR